MKIIFIAGPYIGDGTRKSIERNIREAEKYQIELANRRIGFFCPHNHTEHFSSGKGAKAPESFYYELDFRYLIDMADAMLVVPGWEQSRGTIREVAWAKKHNMTIFFPKHPQDLKEVEKWYHE